MPSYSLADITQRDWIRACQKLGLTVQINRGKGGHVLVKHPTSREKYTVQSDLHKHLNQKIMKKLVSWNITEEQVFEALR